jgi:hypothetical protein
MHRFIDGEDRMQQALLPHSLEDYVDGENPVRVIEVFIEVGWMQRRRDALDASTRSLTQICECRNVADIVQIQQQWLTDAVQRTASDLNAIANDAAALTSRIARRAPTGDAARQPAPPSHQRAEAEAPLHREAAE